MKDGLLRRLFAIMCRDISEIHITPSGLLIPTKHEVDSFRELGVIPFIDAAGKYPEVSKTISRSLVRAEVDLPSPSLILVGACFYILNADLFIIVC